MKCLVETHIFKFKAGDYILRNNKSHGCQAGAGTNWLPRESNQLDMDGKATQMARDGIALQEIWNMGELLKNASLRYVNIAVVPC